DGLDLAIDGVPPGYRAFGLILRDSVVVGKVLFIAPLVRMNVVPTGGVLQSDRTPYPVSGEGNGVPGLSGSQLLLPDIVRQPATIDADTSAENQGIDGCPVHQVAVIPVIDTGADNHRTFAASVFSGRRPIPRKPNDVVARQSSVFFRPGGSIGSSL